MILFFPFFFLYFGCFDYVFSAKFPFYCFMYGHDPRKYVSHLEFGITSRILRVSN